MELSYSDYLFLDLFSTDEPRKLNSLYHIITGKRTVSVLLQAMRMDLGAYFSLLPKLTMAVFESRIDRLVRRRLLTADYLLTAEARELTEIFFSTHRRASNKKQLKYQTILSVFKNRCLFLTQVSSERVHRNKKYLPIQPRLAEQVWLKGFLQRHHLHEPENCKNIGKEWLLLLSRAEITRSDIFVEQFEGHQKSKLTTKQMGEKYGLENMEVYIQLQQDWITAVEIIADSGTEFPLLASLLTELTAGAGLCSESSRETYQLWAKGLSIEEISRKRVLKPSTINDHLTEMAVLYRDFPYAKFLGREHLEYVKAAVKAGVAIDYNDIQDKFPGVTFFQSRLMQVMGGTINE